MTLTFVGAALLAALGLFLLSAGQADDSPGLGGIGLLVLIGAVVLVVRGLRRRS